MMPMPTEPPVKPETLIEALRHANAFPHAASQPIEIHQTHISWVVLAGNFAYKIKQPVKTDFLDYSTLELRQHYCQEELRLNARYASDLYLGVVPITLRGGRIEVEGDGETIEYAVKMRRFPKGALLSERIQTHRVTTAEVHRLAEKVASFHASANQGRDGVADQWPDFLVRDVHKIIQTLKHQTSQPDLPVRSSEAKRTGSCTPGRTPAVATGRIGSTTTLKVLQDWSSAFFRDHLRLLTDRIDAGFVRECHGDLHLGNVVFWNGQWVPFDGIEFNAHLQWIDVLSDAAFLAMDFAARGHLDQSRSFMNAYLEQTGDYRSLGLLRLFLFYRALVRALAATMRDDHRDRWDHIELAYRFTLRETPRLWITHGFSGSGKTTLSEAVVQRHDAVRLRSDIERKRLFGLTAMDRPSPAIQSAMHDQQSNRKTYTRLRELTHSVLDAGYSVVIDATFLKQTDRQPFYDLALRRSIPFAILDCHSDPQTLRQRIADRMDRDDDASDADLGVLDFQIAHQEPLSNFEQQFVVDVPDVVQIADRL